MFPGQSSRHAEMFARARTIAPAVAAGILERASDLLGEDVERWGAGGFASNRYIQLAVFIANHIHLRALEEAGVVAGLSLGLSLGEYNHLVHIGALEFEEALRLVDARGRAYDQGPSGAMAAVFPLTLEEIEPLVVRAAEVGELAISNLNSPTQHVVGGERTAVEALMALVEEETFASAQVIEEHIPMHTPRFQPVVEAFMPALEAAAWKTPRAPYLPNVTGDFLADPTSSKIIDMLKRHVAEPVLWRRSLETMAAAFPEAVFVEAGPGHVLTGLLRRSWLDVPRHATDHPGALTGAVKELRSDGA